MKIPGVDRVFGAGQGDEGAPCFEIGLAIDPEAPLPQDAELVLEHPGGAERLPIAAGFDGGDGYLSFRFFDVESTGGHNLSFVRGGESSPFFEYVRLGDYFNDAEGPSAATVLAVRVTDADGAPVEIESASLGGMRLLNGDELPDWGVQLDRLAGGDLPLAVTAGEKRELSLRVDLGEGAEANVRFGGKRPGWAFLTRVRAGSPGNWSVVYFLMTLVSSARRALILPCSTPGSEKDASYCHIMCKQLRGDFEELGYAVDVVDVSEQCNWPHVIAQIEQAAAQGRRYERFVTVGHGGWDGPMLYDVGGTYQQASRISHVDLFERLVEALKTALTPSSRSYANNCHCGGNDRVETKAAKLDQRKQELEAEFPEADRPGHVQGELDRLLAEIEDLRAVGLQAFNTDEYVWVDDVARRTGRFFAGPMGYTATGFARQHVQAVLEGAGVVKQAVWAADPPAGVTRLLRPSGSLANAKTIPLEGALPVAPAPAQGEARPLPLPTSLPQMLLMPLTSRGLR